MSAPVWLVTGAGSGVGRTLAVALAASGAEVMLTARNLSRLEDTARWCGPSASIHSVDLADTEGVEVLVKQAAERLAGRPLAGVIHAAGVAVWNSPETNSGWSLVPLVNALSPWRLTLGLEPALLASENPRILFVSGAPMTLKGVRPDPTRWKGEQKGRGLALALEAASAKVVMARSLHEKWSGRGAVFAFHPGFVKSNLTDGLPFPLKTLGCLAQPFLSARSATGEFLALNPEVSALSGNLVSGVRAVPDCPFPKEKASEEALLSLLI